MFEYFYNFIEEVVRKIVEIILNNNFSLNSEQFLFVSSLNDGLYYGANLDSGNIDGKPLGSNFSKQALSVSVYVVFYICAYTEGFVT